MTTHDGSPPRFTVVTSDFEPPEEYIVTADDYRREIRSATAAALREMAKAIDTDAEILGIPNA